MALSRMAFRSKAFESPAQLCRLKRHTQARGVPEARNKLALNTAIINKGDVSGSGGEYIASVAYNEVHVPTRQGALLSFTMPAQAVRQLAVPLQPLP